MNFPLILFLLTAFTLCMWLLDVLVLAPGRRRQAEAFAPIYVRLSYLPSKARPDPAESDFDADESEIIASD